MLKTDKLDTLKENTRATILDATKFMIHHGVGKEIKNDEELIKVRSTSPDIPKYGIWPTTEFLEVLLKNDVLPNTQEIVSLIDGMVGFILEKYNNKVKKWPLTDAKGAITSAITSGHCIHVLKLYISRQFVDHAKVELIKQIIREAEVALIADCRQDGSWKITDSDDTLDTELNEGRFFYSYNAWFGIRKVKGYSDDLPTLPDVRARLSRYIIDVSNKLLVELNDERAKRNVSILSKSICNIARAIQILNDFEDTNCLEMKKRLCNAILQTVVSDDKVNEELLKDLFESPSSVDILELPNSVYNRFSNNVPFDLFFAIKAEPDCLDVARATIDWYLANIDRKTNCWFFLGTKMNTWPTCEALLVLCNAHKFFFWTAIKQHCKQELKQVEKKHEKCKECREEIDSYLKPQKQQFKKTMDDCVRKIKKTSVLPTVIAIVACMCAIAALIALSIILEQYWVNSLITVVIIPLIMQIIFVVKTPEYSDKMQNVPEEILSTIEERKEMWNE